MSKETELRGKIEDIILHIDENIRIDKAYDPIASIMSLIKANCWLRGEQKLLDNPYNWATYVGLGYEKGQRDILEAGWKFCQE